MWGRSNDKYYSLGECDLMTWCYPKKIGEEYAIAHTLLKINPVKALVNAVQTRTLKLVLGRRKLVILKEDAMVFLTFVAETHWQRLIHFHYWLSVRSNTFVLGEPPYLKTAKTMIHYLIIFFIIRMIKTRGGVKGRLNNVKKTDDFNIHHHCMLNCMLQTSACPVPIFQRQIALYFSFR